MVRLPARPWVSAGDLATISGEKPVDGACGYWEIQRLAALHKKEADGVCALPHRLTVTAVTDKLINRGYNSKHHADGHEVAAFI